jgi:hypothetical protein
MARRSVRAVSKIGIDESTKESLQEQQSRMLMTQLQVGILAAQRMAGNLAVTELLQESVENLICTEDPFRRYRQLICVRNRSGIPSEPGFPNEKELEDFNRQCRAETGYIGEDVSLEEIQEVDVRSKELQVAPLSHELKEAPLAPSAKLRVKCWLQEHGEFIIAAEKRFRVDRRAIAGAIAWEALENIHSRLKLSLSRAALGPGKVHTREYRLLPSWLYTGDTAAEHVEKMGYLPSRTEKTRQHLLETEVGAIEYVGAIMASCADIAEQFGYCIRCNPSVLTWCYNAKTPEGWREHLKAKKPGTKLRPLGKMSSWVNRNISYLEKCIGTPSEETCIHCRRKELEEQVQSKEEELAQFYEFEEMSFDIEKVAYERTELETELLQEKEKLAELVSRETQLDFKNRIRILEDIIKKIDQELLSFPQPFTPAFESKKQVSIDLSQRTELQAKRHLYQTRVEQLKADLVEDHFRRKVYLTPAEISKLRNLIKSIELCPRLKEDLFERLQEKVEYLNERDNLQAGETVIGGTCNLTSLAMCLSYLGVPNPHPELQYEDALEKVRVDSNFGPRWDRSGWGAVAEKLGVQHEVFARGVSEDKAWYEEHVRDAHLRQGHAVMMSISGHIVRVQAVTEAGLVVDDPYGKAKLLPGTARSWEKFNPSKFSPGAGSARAGEDVVWPWSQVKQHTMKWIAYFNRK